MVYVFLTDGFEELETVAPIDLIRRAGIDVVTVGVGTAMPAGAHGIRIACDADIDGALAADAEMLVLPGGPGHVKLGQNARLREMLMSAAANGTYIGAICAAPAILGELGILAGKNATCYPGYEGSLGGAILADKGTGVVRDDKIITARGAGVAVEFALKLIEVLRGVNTANAVRDSIQCR